MIFAPRREPLAKLPTPLLDLARLGTILGGPRLLIKRDDLGGFALGGNKVRKLEFFLADARTAGADVLITCGGVQSNHCRVTAAAAARAGLGENRPGGARPGWKPSRRSSGRRVSART